MSESTGETSGSELAAGAVLERSWRTLVSLVRRGAYLGVTGGGESLCVARAALKGKRAAVTLRRGAEGISEADVTNVRTVRLCVPRHMFLAKELLLPSADADEIQGMLGFEISGLFPVSAEELTWAWCPIEVTAEGYTRLRVLAIVTETLEGCLAEAGLEGEHRVEAEASTVSLANLFLAGAGSWPEEPVALVSVWDDNIDFAVVGSKGLEFDRGAARSGAAGDPGHIAAEVAVSLSLYGENARSAPVTRIYLLSSSRGEGVVGALRGETGLPVERLEPPDFLDTADVGGSEGAAAAATAFGPFLEEGLSVGLVPEKQRERGALCGRVQSAVFTTFLALLVVGLSWGALALRSRRVLKAVQVLETEAALKAPDADKIDAKKQRLLAIKRQLATRGVALRVLVELYKNTPPDISLTLVKLDKEGLLTIKGHCQEGFRATEYALLLDKSGAFRRAGDLPYDWRQREERGKTFITFTIVKELARGKE